MKEGAKRKTSRNKRGPFLKNLPNMTIIFTRKLKRKTSVRPSKEIPHEQKNDTL